MDEALDDHARFAGAGQQAGGTRDHLLHIVPCRHHAEDDVACGKVRHLVRHLRAVRRQRLGFGARAIPHRHIGTSLGEPGRHFVPHAADADPADSFVHSLILSLFHRFNRDWQ
jgi:hypothetical protein